MPVIYQPQGRAGEYAEWACNVYSGCGHGCVYCYGPSTLRKTRGDFEQAGPRPDTFFNQLEKDAQKLAGLKERVLLCFTCDPYQPIDDELQHTRRTIEILQANDINVTILTKGGCRSLRDLELLKRGNNAYAATLTTLSDSESIKWEPEAALPQNRIEALRRFHGEGVETWISLEPVIDPRATMEIIARTSFVDYYKVGKLNYENKLPPKLRSQVAGIDWRQFAINVTNLLELYGYRRCFDPHKITKGQYYIKKDLVRYLPLLEVKWTETA